ncbi:MAG: M23 family metallopeptidase [Gemmatimonadales bacterium]
MARGLFLLCCSLLGPAAAAAQLPGMVPFDVRASKGPTPVRSGDRDHLVYELRVTNLARRGGAIKRLEARVGGTVLAAWEGDSLRRHTTRIGESGDGRVIPAGRQSLVYLHVAVAPGAAPAAIEHRFFVTHADSLDAGSVDTLSGVTVPVARQTAVVVRSPLKDGPWVAVNGPGNASGHRRTVIPLEGLARIPQRFATDWIKLGPDGQGWKGDSTKNENWYGYNMPLLAVASGTVVAVKDGIIENVPFSPKMAVPITLETVGGNHVILDLGNGNYGFYAHIIPGTIPVKVGDKVKAGQEIGRLGNSGNSTAPHLHFHLGDANSPLGTEGIPFLIEEYAYQGRVTNFLGAWTPSGTTVDKKRELPLENEVVRFKP